MAHGLFMANDTSIPSVAHPLHPPRKEKHLDVSILALGADSHLWKPVSANDKLHFLCADAEEAKNGHLDA